MFQTKVVDKIKTHILCLFFNHAVIEKMWMNITDPDWPQMTV